MKGVSGYPDTSKGLNCFVLLDLYVGEVWWHRSWAEKQCKTTKNSSSFHQRIFSGFPIGFWVDNFCRCNTLRFNPKFTSINILWCVKLNKKGLMKSKNYINWQSVKAAKLKLKEWNFLTCQRLIYGLTLLLCGVQAGIVYEGPTAGLILKWPH